MKNELERLVNEIAAQNRLIALLIAKYDVDPFKEDVWRKPIDEFKNDMKDMAKGITSWAYSPLDKEIPLNHPNEKTRNLLNKNF